MSKTAKSIEKQEKIAIRRMISNVLYVLGYAWREDKRMILTFIIGKVFESAGHTIVGTVFLKLVIDMISNDTPFINILYLMLIQMAFHTLVIVVDVFTGNYFEINIVRISGNVQRNLIEKASRMDLIYYDKPEYFNDFVIAAQQGEEMVKNAVTSIAFLLARVFSILVAGSLIFFINPIIAIFPIIGFTVNIITRFAITRTEYLYELEKKKINRKSDYSKRVFYQPEFAKEIKLSDIAVPLKAQFNQSLDEEKMMAKKYGRKIAILSLINWIMVFTFLSYFCIPLYLGYLAIEKMKIKLGDVASLNNAANDVRNNLDGLNYALVDFQKVGQYAEKFRVFNDYEEKIESTKGTEEVPDDSVLEIKNMSYKYDGAENYTLHNVNLTVKKGEKIAIVGENGAGKTTLIKLLMRLYDITEGEITYGGKDIRNFNIKEYRAKIGAVFQDYQIYGGSLGENVLMDEYDSQYDANIQAALEKADFSSKLEKIGGDFNIELTKEFSEEGTMLSGGEGQKVAVSRMFVKGECPIAILDEPSSALDPIAEYALNNNMMENAKDSTIIFISHRLSTTREADKIYLFEHGEIIEQGTHQELMDLGGHYAEMFEVQSKYYKLNI